MLLSTAAYAAGRTEARAALRETYLAAELLFKERQFAQYTAAKAALGDYPLVAYLEYEELQLPDPTPAALADFLVKYPNFPYNSRLRSKLVDLLYEQEDWAGIVNQTQTTSCVRLLAQHRLGQDPQRLKAALEARWSGGDTLDAKCDIVIREQQLNLYQDSAAIWRRIEASLAKRRWSNLKPLSSRLSAAERTSYNLLWQLRGSKRRLGRLLDNLADNPRDRLIIHYALTHYPAAHIDEAYQLYTEKIATAYSLSPQQRSDIEYHLGLHLTLNGELLGFSVLYATDPTRLSEFEQGWRARSAIKFQQWALLLEIIAEFPPALRSSPTWQFWQAYAWEQLGEPERGLSLLAAAAKDRSFYGFLAAERAGLKKSINHQGVSYSSDVSIWQQPTYQRFLELMALGRTNTANSEWNMLLPHASRDELLYLAASAHSRKWYFHAITGFTAASYWDDLVRRFPTPYQPYVTAAAKQNQLPAALIYSIMRTESSFRAAVSSRAGAVGLMQVLPPTGRALIREVNYQGNPQLTTPQTSIDLGTIYLRRLASRYDNNLILSLAAYNAGPRRVADWLPPEGSIPAIEWLETIPFRETRRYLRSVLFAYVIFEWRLHDEPGRLTDKMLAVGE